MNITTELLDSLHKDVRNDVEHYLADETNNHDCFSEKHYKAAIRFNRLINYSGEDNNYCLYSGGLGHGSYVQVFFDLNSKDYYVIFSDFDSSNKNVPMNKWCASKNWTDVVEYLDNFFSN